MTQFSPLPSLEPDTCPDCQVLSSQLDEALSTRSLLEEDDGNILFSVSRSSNYTKLKNIQFESSSVGRLSVENECFNPQLSYEPSANFWTEAKQYWNGPLPGWRKTLVLNSLYIAIILLINILWLVITMSKSASEQGIYTLYKGSCSKASTTNSALHVLVNILSTALLASSNYAIQCLTSPTRTEVERAHEENKWLYIGIPNIKNLFWMSWWRKLLVILLVLSSWPLHLLWNSVVFKTLQGNQYGVLVVSTDFYTSQQFDDNMSNINASETLPDVNIFSGFNTTDVLGFSESLYNKTKDLGSMLRLKNTECIKTYAQTLISNRRNLLLVTNTTLHPLPSNQSPTNGSMLAYMDSQDWQKGYVNGGWDSNDFICSNSNGSWLDNTVCNVENVLKHANNWTMAPSTFSGDGNDSYEIDYCLSEVVDEVCQVQLNLPLMVAVIICNFVKLICVVSSVFAFQEPPLVIIGDALASFLNKKDDSEFLQYKNPMRINQFRSWGYVARSDLVTTIVLSSVTMGVAGLLLSKGIRNLKWSGQTFSSLGFGQANPGAIILLPELDSSQSSGLLTSVLILVNSPQIVFTILYIIYNRACTKMLAMHEWTKFAGKQRSLRVSQPSGIQRSTYWLHLPYRYSIPLIVVSTLMHWFISESIFLVRVAFYDKNGQPDLQQGDSTTSSNILSVPGYSPQAMVAAIVLGAIMLLTLFLLSLRKFESAMPLVGNNSWKISTACHRPDEDEQAASKAVKWGAVSHPEGTKAGHCCLTSFDVEPPIKDELYTM